MLEQKFNNKKGGVRVVYNYDKLIGRIIEIFRSRAKFSVAMGISERTLSLKLNNEIDFKQDEIIKACDLLSIEHTEIPIYFFDINVQCA